LEKVRLVRTPEQKKTKYLFGSGARVIMYNEKTLSGIIFYEQAG